MSISSTPGRRTTIQAPKRPFLTIQRAAEVVEPAEKALIKSGIYREWIQPRRAGPDPLDGPEDEFAEMGIGADVGVMGDSLPVVVGVAVGELPDVLLTVGSLVIPGPVPGVVVEDRQRSRGTDQVDGPGHVLPVGGADEPGR